MRVNDTVRTADELSRKEFLADKAFKLRRRAGSCGFISGIIGKRDPRYLVVHEGETEPAVYLEEELDIEPNAYWKVTYSQQGLSCFTEVETYEDVEDLRKQLEREGTKSAIVEGPFYSDKELTEGLLPARSLFDHLKGVSED
jgi:hypothetical protein